MPWIFIIMWIAYTTFLKLRSMKKKLDLFKSKILFYYLISIFKQKLVKKTNLQLEVKNFMWNLGDFSIFIP